TVRRWETRGGSRELVYDTALWAFPAGLIGGRLYFDLTSWGEVPADWWGPFAIWEGGLGIWGGIALGVAVGLWRVKRAGADVPAFMDAGAPALLVAQSIGRVGNWFNQELFGKPTDLPWGLKIDPEHRVAGYEDHATFHPTFLYEFVYDLIGVGLLLALDRLYRFKPPALFALYVSYYTAGRFCEELLRIDPAHEFAGLRLNAWVSLVVFVCSTAFFVWWQFLRGGEEGPRWVGRRRRERREPEGPAMAIPRGRVR
ncbi:MAG: prolipoprotein diacylglyceryl transferase family protein, partial [Solirubrobacteraceae bacterium]